MKLSKFHLLPVALLLAPLASATALYGQFGFTGPGVLVFNSGGADFIEFCTTVSGNTCSNTNTGTGSISVTGPGTYSFSNLTANEAGTIDNTTDVTPPAPDYEYLPVATPTTLNNYITLSGADSNVNFQANDLPLATCMTTADQECIGPFQLDQDGNNVVVTANVYGTIINTGTGTPDMSAFDLILTGQYTDTTIAAVISGATSSGGAFSDSWSGTLVAPAPEPMSSALVGIGLLIIGLVNRKSLSLKR